MHSGTLEQVRERMGDLGVPVYTTVLSPDLTRRLNELLMLCDVYDREGQLPTEVSVALERVRALNGLHLGGA